LTIAGLGLAALANWNFGTGGFLFGLALAAVVAGLVLREPDKECSFCGASRAQVKQLVAGPAAAICDRCLPVGLKTVLELQPTRWSLVIDALPPHAPRAVSTPLLVRAGEAPEREYLDAVLRTCFELNNPDAARMLLEAVPEAERTAAQWINLGVVLGHLGRFDDAIAATRRAEQSEAWVLNNVAAFMLEAEPQRRQVQPLVDDLLRARELLATVAEATRPALRRSILVTLAELHRRQGAFIEAVAALDEAEREGNSTGEAASEWRLTRARVFLDQGRTAEAHALLCEVAKAGHPESSLTLEAHRLLARDA
jgi:tetratricopeptide (TPR) repeat protein